MDRCTRKWPSLFLLSGPHPSSAGRPAACGWQAHVESGSALPKGRVCAEALGPASPPLTHGV